MYQKEQLYYFYILTAIDLLAIIISFALAQWFRLSEPLDVIQSNTLYLQVWVASVGGYWISMIVFDQNNNSQKRGYYKEFVAVLMENTCIIVTILVYLYAAKRSQEYSRIILSLFFLINVVLTYIGRETGKKVIKKGYRNSRGNNKIMLVTTSGQVVPVMERIKNSENWFFYIEYLAIVDADMVGQSIEGIPVVANLDNMVDVATNLEMDAVFFNIPYQAEVDVAGKALEFQKLGATVHINIQAYDIEVSYKTIERLGDFRVVSYGSHFFESRKLFMKRTMDIVGGFAGLAFTAIIGVFVAAAIKIESPGPVIFSQIRVGKNGRRFKLYKFRSMYVDAEARKKELVEQNQIKGAMFKMENDPRITKVGKWIRRTSIDELPQFFNVLKGDMSLVGTRPPTVDEIEQYEHHHKRRLSITPGITGLWQTSGRSQIKDFDEVVKLDLEYIDNWNLGYDMKLIIKTLVILVSGKGAV